MSGFKLSQSKNFQFSSKHTHKHLVDDTDSSYIDVEKYTPEIPNQPTDWTDQEYELFSLVSRGHVKRVKEFLERYKNVDALNDKINQDGYTIWHVAIHRHDESMLAYLLTLSAVTILYDLLLHTILEEDMTLVEMVHGAIKDRHPDISSLSDLPRWKYSRYLPEVTPMILAAKQGSYELIEYFHQNGERLVDMREVTMNYPFYEQESYNAVYKPMELSKNHMLLHLCAAASSPAMICYQILNTDNDRDFVWEVLEFIEVLHKLCTVYHEHKDRFHEVSHSTKEFLTEIFDGCRTMAEVETFLKQPEGKSGYEDKYPRALLVIERRLYTLITHPHFQTLMYLQWAGRSWPSWRKMATFWKMYHVLVRIVALPFISIWLLVDAWSDAAQFFRSPINRCINDFASYVYFLALLTAEAHMLYTHDTNYHNTPCKPLEIAIMLFVLGHSISLIQRCVASPKEAVWTGWNWFEFLQLFFFITTFTLWILTWLDEATRPMPPSIPRYHWDAYDTVICGEAFFALALVISYIRLMRFLQLNFLMGPTQIALARMVKDVAIFFVFFSIVALSFALGFYFMYSRFCTQKLNIGSNGAHVILVTNDFGSYPKATQSLFWGLLGMADSDAAIFIDKDSTHAKHGSSALFVQQIGRALWMIYHLVATMILMNMLIGYLSNTLTAIENNLESTWMYNRSQVWMYYMRSTTLPPPFNILPSLHFFKLTFKWFRRRRYPEYGDQVPVCSVYRCCYEATRESPRERELRQREYRNLLKILAQRYLRSKLEIEGSPKGEDKEAPTCDISGQLSQFKSRLQSILGMASKPASAPTSPKENLSIGNSPKRLSDAKRKSLDDALGLTLPQVLARRSTVLEPGAGLATALAWSRGVTDVKKEAL